MNNFETIFEDDHIIVINKPSGVVVNISETSPENTIQNVLNEYLNIDSMDDSEFARRAGIVHRIDKDTSGALVVAKNPESFYNIKDQFKTREVKKDYLAIVLGEIEDKLITVKAPIARDPKNRMRMAIVKGGRFALTNFELLESLIVSDEQYSLVLAKPLTGRTHQIRVHLSGIGHPVASDPIYLGAKRYESTYKIFGRLMLHAWHLEFSHPESKKRLYFEAKIPEEYKKVITIS